MHIAIVSPGSLPLPPAPCTSVEIYAKNLAQTLQRNHDVTLTAKGSKTARQKTGQLTIRTWVTKGGLPYLRRVLPELRAHKKDVIQIENRVAFAPVVKKAFPKTPVMLNLHSNVLIQALPPQTVQSSLQAIDALVVNSHYLKRFLLAKYPVLAESKVHVIHPAIDPSHFPSRFTSRGQTLRLRTRQQLGVDPGKKVVLFVGRMIPRKGLTVLLEAFRQVWQQHSEAELWVIGGRLKRTAFHQSLRRQAQGLPVRFLGYINQSRLPNYYLAADLFVCPSQRPEAFGMVNIEASATGLPVIASKGWGIQEAVQEQKNGVLVPEFKSASAFAKQISGLLEQSERLNILGKSARAWAEQEFSWQRNAAHFEELYQKLISSPKGVASQGVQLVDL